MLEQTRMRDVGQLTGRDGSTARDSGNKHAAAALGVAAEPTESEGKNSGEADL